MDLYNNPYMYALYNGTYMYSLPHSVPATYNQRCCMAGLAVSRFGDFRKREEAWGHSKQIVGVALRDCLGTALRNSHLGMRVRHHQGWFLRKSSVWEASMCSFLVLLFCLLWRRMTGLRDEARKPHAHQRVS